MSAAQNKGLSEQQKKTIVIAVFSLLVVGVILFNFSDTFFGPAPAPPPPPVIITKTAPKIVGTNSGASAPPGFIAKGEAQKVGSTSQALDPTLHMEAMLVTESVVYSGTGRNIFAVGPAVYDTPAVHDRKKIPDVIVPVRTPPAGPPIAQGPPPINLKFFGMASRKNGERRAFLLRGDDVFLASAGDIVDRRYKVVSIAANSIVIDDLANNNTQTLPLQAN